MLLRQQLMVITLLRVHLLMLFLVQLRVLLWMRLLRPAAFLGLQFAVWEEVSQVCCLTYRTIALMAERLTGKLLRLMRFGEQ